MENEIMVPYEEEHNTNEFSDQTPDQVMTETSSPLDRQAMRQYLPTKSHIVFIDAPAVHDHEADIGLEIEMTGTGIQPDETPKQANIQNIIPPSFMETVVSLLLSVKSIPPRTRCTLLVFFGSVIRFLEERLIYQDEKSIERLMDQCFELGNSCDTKRPLLSFWETFGEFWPHIRDETAIMVIYALVLLLIWPMQLAYQVMIMVMLIGVPVYYIPDLWGKMSGVDVTCGMIKLPLFCVTTLTAIALFFIFGFLILLLIYLIQQYIPPERSRGIKLEGSNIMEDFSVIVDEMKVK